MQIEKRKNKQPTSECFRAPAMGTGEAIKIQFRVCKHINVHTTQPFLEASWITKNTNASEKTEETVKCVSSFYFFFSFFFSKWNFSTEFFNMSPGGSEVSYTSCLKQMQNICHAANTLLLFPLPIKKINRKCGALRAKEICKKKSNLSSVLLFEVIVLVRPLFRFTQCRAVHGL